MDKTKLLNVAMIQRSCEIDSQLNCIEIEKSIRVAANNNAKLILLAELHNTRYFCQTDNSSYFDLAETIPGPSSTIFAALSKQLGIVIVCSIFEKRTAGLYHNTAVVLDKGAIAGMYRKMHIPHDPAYNEKFYFTPGDINGFTPIATSLGKLGLLICWDQWFPEAARIMTLKGADMLLYPTAIGWSVDANDANKQCEIDAWTIVQRSHAITNSLPLLCCNRTGVEMENNHSSCGIEFWGSSFVCGAKGEYLAQATHNQDTVLYANIDMTQTEQVRREWPYLRDRRIEAYGELQQRFIDPC